MSSSFFDIIKFKENTFLFILLLFALISSELMLLLSSLPNFPKSGASYVGIHYYNEYLIILFSVFVLGIVFITSNFLCNIFVKKFDFQICISSEERRPVRSIIIFFVFLCWGLSILVARNYGVEMPYKEELSGVPRYVIYAFYRALLPIISAIILLRTEYIFLPIIISIFYSFLSYSRFPLLLIFSVVIFNLLNIKNYKKLFAIVIVFLITSVFVSYFRYKVNEKDIDFSILYNIIKDELIKIIIETPYDFISTSTSRFVSHVDMLLIWNWDIDNVFFLYLNKFWGITTSKYNFSFDMQNLFHLVPDDFRMNAIGPFGIIVALSTTNLSGFILSIIGVSIILILIQLTVFNISRIIKISLFESQLIKLLIFIEWLWMSAHMALITILITILITKFIKVRRNDQTISLD